MVVNIIFRLILLALFAISLEGCGGCTQDPAQAGFFCGVQNIAQGTYGERQTTLRSEAEGTEAAAQQRSDQLRALQSQEASLATERQEIQRKLRAVQADINKQKQLLASARLHRQVDQDTLSKLETRLKALQQKRIQLEQSDNTSPQEVEDLKRDIRRLDTQIAEVLKYTAVE